MLNLFGPMRTIGPVLSPAVRYIYLLDIWKLVTEKERKVSVRTIFLMQSDVSLFKMSLCDLVQLPEPGNLRQPWARYTACWTKKCFVDCRDDIPRYRKEDYIAREGC